MSDKAFLRHGVRSDAFFRTGSPAFNDEPKAFCHEQGELPARTEAFVRRGQW